MLIKCGASAVAEARVFNVESEDQKGASSKFSGTLMELERVRERHPDYMYLRTRAIGNLCVDGPNSNADAFPYEHFDDVRPGFGYKSFIGKKAFEEHQSYSLANAVGELLDAHLNRFDLGTYGDLGWKALSSEQKIDVLAAPDQMDGTIEVLMGIDRKRAPAHIARQIDVGEMVPVSMGTNVQFSDCSVCGNRAFWEKDYCDHVLQKGRLFTAEAEDLRGLMKEGILRLEWMPWIVADQRELDTVLGSDRMGAVKVAGFEINHGLSFFELSFVANAAYYKGRSLEKVASGGRAVFLNLEQLKNAYDGEIYQEIIRRDGEIVARMSNDRVAVRVHIGAGRKNVIPIPMRFLEFEDREGSTTMAGGKETAEPKERPGSTEETRTVRKDPLEITAVELSGGRRFVADKVVGVTKGERTHQPSDGGKSANDTEAGTSSNSAATTVKGVQALRERLSRLRGAAGRRGRAPGRRRTAFDQAPGESSKDAMEDYNIFPASDDSENAYNAESASATDSQIDKERTFDLTLPEGHTGIEEAEIWAKQASSKDRVPAKTAWIVYRGSSPQWIVTFGTLAKRRGTASRAVYRQFCSRAYGRELLKTIDDFGLEKTRRAVCGTRIPRRRSVSRRDPFGRSRASVGMPRSRRLRSSALERRATPPPDAAEQRAYYSQLFPDDYVSDLLATPREERRRVLSRERSPSTLPRRVGRLETENTKLRRIVSKMLQGQQKRLAVNKGRFAYNLIAKVAEANPGHFTRDEFEAEIRRLAALPLAALKVVAEYMQEYGATDYFPPTNDPATAEEESGIQNDSLRGVSNPSGDPVDVDDPPTEVLEGQTGLGEMDMSPVSAGMEGDLDGVSHFAGAPPQMTETAEDLQYGGSFVDEVSRHFRTTPGELEKRGIYVEPHNVIR